MIPQSLGYEVGEFISQIETHKSQVKYIKMPLLYKI